MTDTEAVIDQQPHEDAPVRPVAIAGPIVLPARDAVRRRPRSTAVLVAVLAAAAAATTASVVAVLSDDSASVPRPVAEVRVSPDALDRSPTIEAPAAPSSQSADAAERWAADDAAEREVDCGATSASAVERC